MNNPTERNDMSGTTARTVDQASSSIHKAIDSASAMARPAVDHLAASAHQAVDKMANAANKAADTIGQKSEQLSNVQARITETCRSQVREKPMTAVGIALAAGFLLSWWLSPRK